MTLIYSTTILLSAFLLFTIQLIIGKVMLPYFGGSPSVWNTSMMFYQILLLAGYVYAHILGTRVAIRWQPVIHWALIAASLVFIAFTINPDQLANASTAPIITQLKLMCLVVGLPFFVLSATAPLIQRWFFITQPDANAKAYLLYATSNLGSFLALLAYPFLIEPLLNLDQQTHIWRFLQFTLVALFVISGLSVMDAKSARIKQETVVTKTPPIPLKRILFWILLAFIPSSLSLGVTMKITTDIASMPLIWVIPLALYLLTFVMAFRDRAPVSVQSAFGLGLAFTLLFAACSIHLSIGHTLIGMLAALLSFFTLAYACHRKLFEDRPDAQHLTAYYIYLSVGGAIGGIFNSLVVPNVLTGAYEYDFALILALITLAFSAGYIKRQPIFKTLVNYPLTPMLTAMGIVVLLAYFFFLPMASIWIIGLMLIIAALPMIPTNRALFTTVASILLCIPVFFSYANVKPLLQERNYFGVKRVLQNGGERHFTHGTTNHGSQILEEKYRLTPVTYYNPTSPAADIMKVAGKRTKNPDIMIMGLGIGGLTCLTDKNAKVGFIEIDPDVIRLAEDRNYFTFVSDCGPKEKTMIVGDGRLQLAKQPDNTFDLLFMDAFSSDSIPFHLMTVDAVNGYLQKLKPDGMLAFHISNRYFVLSAELAAVARDAGIHIYARSQQGGFIPGTKYPYSGTDYMVMTKNPDILKRLQAEHSDWHEYTGKLPVHAWRDDYVNVIRAFKFVHDLENRF